ncbi:hypothetical protein [Jatrophihabitans sp.]|uniref:hypothetical protein n=1 Tax=Jatrophihabitans sp. TaxID=1932789 RepID=UPI0030C6E4EA|nr:hypothetical protein [Jatrophihabitans sp.]
MADLVLPNFEMNCQDWLVTTPEDSGLPNEVAGAPLLAVLSTVVLGEDSFSPASAIVTVGLNDDGAPMRPIDGGCVASLLVDGESGDTEMRYVVPTPDGRLALLVEFALPDGPEAEVVDRVESLMRSFRWAA